MEIEKMDNVCISVNNLEEAIKLYSSVLDTQFIILNTKVEKNVSQHGNAVAEASRIRMAMDTKGYLELVEYTPPVQKEGLRNIHFKVKDIEKAKDEMRKKGLRLMLNARVGGLKEAIYHPDDMFGVRFCLVEYNAPTMVEACQQQDLTEPTQ